MEANFKCTGSTMIICVLMIPVWVLADISRDQSQGAGESCEPVIRDGKEIPQHPTYQLDRKRSFGKPGTESHPVIHKHCEVDPSTNFPVPLPGQPKDCADIKTNGTKGSGVYVIYPDGEGGPFNVYCDMNTKGGGWTVLQRRMDGSVDFYRNWADYKRGFGSLSSEHWLGNEKMYRLSQQKTYDLRVELRNSTGHNGNATYSRFKLDNETQGYKLTLARYTGGNAGDSLLYHTWQKFHTYDHETENGVDCARSFKAGWWFKRCLQSNMNGIYSYGLRWITWSDKKLKYTEMKIRPENSDNLHHDDHV